MKTTSTKTEKCLEIINWAIGNKVSHLNSLKWDKELELFDGNYEDFANSFKRKDVDEELALKKILKRLNVNAIYRNYPEEELAKALLQGTNGVIISEVVTELFN